MKARIVVLPGDGVGPEVAGAAQQVLESVGRKFGHQLAFETQLMGGIAIDETGDPLPEATLTACKAAEAVLLGAVGGPKWDDPAAKTRPASSYRSRSSDNSLWPLPRTAFTSASVIPGCTRASSARSSGSR